MHPGAVMNRFELRGLRDGLILRKAPWFGVFGGSGTATMPAQPVVKLVDPVAALARLQALLVVLPPR